MLGFQKAGVFAYLLVSTVLGVHEVESAVASSRHEGHAIPGVGRVHDDGMSRRQLLSMDSTGSGRTAMVVFQQDEADLLFDWIFYHSQIFGANRLYVIDHNSTVPPVTHLLSYAETAGVNVIRFDGPFIQKHRMLTDTIHSIFNDVPEVDTVIPVDIDEFVVAEDLQASNDVTYTTSQAVILSHIDALPRDGFKYKLGAIQAAACNVENMSMAEPRHRRALTAMYFSSPAKTGPRKKTFYAREGFIQTDQGNHIGKVENDATCEDLYFKQADASNLEDTDNDIKVASTLTFAADGMECFHSTPLAIVHYGVFALSFSMWQRKMQRGAQAYGYTENTECTGAGVHYCKAVQAMKEDLEGTRLKREMMHCGRGSRYYSTFMVDALMGRIGSIDYTIAQKLEKVQ